MKAAKHNPWDRAKMSQRVWVIGGTQESRQVVTALCRKLPCAPAGGWVVTVTTEAARSRYPDHPNLEVWVGKLTPDSAPTFLQTYQVGAILDLSHPFATDISALAIALAQAHHLPYLRYERPSLTSSDPQAWRDRQGRPGNVILPRLADLFRPIMPGSPDNCLTGARSLLTLGYRYLPAFAPWQSEAVLFARILPSVEALQTALASGFTPDRLVALRPPIGADLERALWQQWDITQVITKASGSPGGEDQKCEIAAELGIRLIRIARPALAYPQQTDRLDVAIAFAQQL